MLLLETYRDMKATALIALRVKKKLSAEPECLQPGFILKTADVNIVIILLPVFGNNLRDSAGKNKPLRQRREKIKRCI